jgi:DnaJ-class molecular chaperone
MAGKDYYKILGANRSATDKDIKQAYRKLARKHHPDVNPGDKSAEARFKEINSAYDVLSDPEKRKKYDKYGDQWQHADQFEAQHGTPFGGSGGFPGFKAGPGATYEFVDLSDMGDLGDLFGFASGFGTKTKTRRPRRGQDIEYATEGTLEEAYSGSTRVVTDMTGHRLEVKIPPGVNSGSRIKVAGKGEPGIGGGPSGDLYLVVSVKPHRTFQRKDNDLHVEVSVPLIDAVLSGEVEVSSLKGKLSLKIPPETQNGKVFRLAGQGMPKIGSDKKGDLLAKVNVMVPQKLTERERELFQQLKEIQAQPQRGEK